MEERRNELELAGKLSELTKQETRFGVFYGGKLSTVRHSGVEDTLKVVIPKSLLPEAPSEMEGKTVSISGEVRTRHALRADGGSKLIVEAYVK